jgi:hypothetical protein
MRILKTVLLLVFIGSTWSTVEAAQTVSVQLAGKKKTTPAQPPPNGTKVQTPKPKN